MLQRKPVFPNVLEINYQLGQMIGCNVYIVFDKDEWVIIDIGYDESVDDIIETIRLLDLPFSKCKMIIATHADVDHIQGLARLKQVLRADVASHPKAADPLKKGDKLITFAEISAQEISMEMPPVEVDILIDDGDKIQIGDKELEVWSTPGHTDSQLSFRFGDLLFSGDNIYRDGCVGAIDAHHGSDLSAFVTSLKRIKESDIQWLLPSHGPIFKKDDALIEATIKRLEGYKKMADFGTCATEWPLMEVWEKELADSDFPEN